MKRTASLVVLTIFFIAFNTTTALGFNIKLIKNTKLSQETTMLERFIDFCVTEDKLFLIPDYKAGNVKIYDNNGKLVSVFGRKGYGPGEFVKPAYCCYEEKEGKFGVLDYGARKIFIYKRKGKTDFVRVQEANCLAAGNDIQLTNNKLLISGYKSSPDRKHYDLYCIDLTNNQTTYLLPSYYKYDLKSFHEFESQFIKKDYLSAIGIYGWFDTHGDYVYLVWEGDLRIIMINMKSWKLSFFGEKTTQYIKPFASKRLLEGNRTRNSEIVRSEKDKMSYVRDIFTNSKHVLVVYEGPIKKDKPSNFILQFYTLDGNFLGEIPISGKPGKTMYLDKERCILYSISSDLNDDNLNDEYFLLEYKLLISE
jgi:hypothetical protein